MEIRKRFAELEEVLVKHIEKNENEIRKTIHKIIESIKNGNKIMICGNGGSAADAQHFAAELSGKFFRIRKPLPAIALTTNTSAITAIGNDFGFEHIFERQVEGLGKKGDILIAISTSGNSKNVILAVEKARNMSIFTIGLLGKDGGKLKDILDLSIIVPSDITPRIQECHLITYHTICEYVEDELG